jgi:hypothetical protein
MEMKIIIIWTSLAVKKKVWRLPWTVSLLWLMRSGDGSEPSPDLRHQTFHVLLHLVVLVNLLSESMTAWKISHARWRVRDKNHHPGYEKIF